MEYSVVAGDTLSAIAARNGMALQALLEANPELKSHPDAISIGQIINLPNPTPAPGSATDPPAKLLPGWVLGELSERYETGGRGSQTVSSGQGDPGGVSYGSFQMTSLPKPGVVGAFVAQADFPWRADFAGLTPGSGPFTSKWVATATRFPEEFKAAEREYIERTHFDPLCASIKSDDGIDVTQRPHAFQDVIWSTAVQMGPGTVVVRRAFDQMRAAGKFNVAGVTFDHDAIVAIYAERGRKKPDGTLVYFQSSSLDQQKGVSDRFTDECARALQMLADNV